MNLGQIFPQFERDCRGRSPLATQRLFRALVLSVTRRFGGKRRPTGRNTPQLESLEVRQLLSVANSGFPAVEDIPSNSTPLNSSIESQQPASVFPIADLSQPVRPDDILSEARTPLPGMTGNEVPQNPSYVDGGFDGATTKNHEDSGDTVASATLHPSFSDSASTADSAAAETTDDPTGVSGLSDFSSALIDEVFGSSHSVLVDSSLFPSASGDLSQAPIPVDDQFEARIGSSSRPTLSTERFVPESQIPVREGEELRGQAASIRLLLPDDSDVCSSCTDAPASASSVEFSRVPTNWLLWVTEDTAAVRVWLKDSDPESLLSNRSARNAVQLLDDRSRPLQVTQSNVPSQSRRYRENHRQSVVHARLESIARDQFEPPQRLELGNLPRQLKFFDTPRGPPVYGRDADVPFPETNAPADLLKRLRYSIAPRGPSLVTVEMQSPEFLSFSGPRVSLKVWRPELVC